MTRARLAALPVCFALTLAACAVGSDPAAKAAYDECATPDAEINLVELDGRSVAVVVKGDEARAVFGTVDAGDQPVSDEELALMRAVSLSLIEAIACLVEATGYPGMTGELDGGDSWAGWEFDDVIDAGSEYIARFTSTS